MFKKDLYTEIITVLNLNAASTVFKGGYMIAIYDNVPYVVEQSTLNAYDYVKTEVIPVSEEIAQETPSVTLADRSDYIFQYKIMFKSSRETEVLTALDEFRSYYLANKQDTIDGYTVSFKTARGDKQGNIMIQNGDFYSFYTIKVFVTAIKSGYIWKDTDNWLMRIKDEPVVNAGSFVIGVSYKILVVGTTDFTLIGSADNVIGTIFIASGVGTGTGTAINLTYETLILDEETFANSGNPLFSNADGSSKSVVGNTTVNAMPKIFYTGTTLTKKIYAWIMNDVDKDTMFEFIHTFDSVPFSYTGLITTGARTRKDNGVVLLNFSWIEADI